MCIDVDGTCTGSPRKTAMYSIRQHARTYTLLHTIALMTALLSFLVAGIDATPVPVRGSPPLALDRCCHEGRGPKPETTTTTTIVIERTKTHTTHTTTITSPSAHHSHTSTIQTPPTSDHSTSSLSTSVPSTSGVLRTSSSTQPSTHGRSAAPTPTYSSSSILWAKTGTPIPSSLLVDGGSQSSSHSTQRLSRGAIAGIVTGSVVIAVGLAFVTYEVRRRCINKARNEELIARPAGTPQQV